MSDEVVEAVAKAIVDADFDKPGQWEFHTSQDRPDGEGFRKEMARVARAAISAFVSATLKGVGGKVGEIAERDTATKLRAESETFYAKNVGSIEVETSLLNVAADDITFLLEAFAAQTKVVEAALVALSVMIGGKDKTNFDRWRSSKALAEALAALSALENK